MNSSGQVVGVTVAATLTYRMGGVTGGEGFAIPIDRAMGIVNQIRSGAASRSIHLGDNAFIGVGIADTPMGRGGAVVRQVIPDTPARQIGIFSGVLITAVDTTPINSAADLSNVMDTRRPGDTIVLSWIDRAGNPHNAPLVLAKGPVRDPPPRLVRDLLGRASRRGAHKSGCGPCRFSPWRIGIGPADPTCRRRGATTADRRPGGGQQVAHRRADHRSGPGTAQVLTAVAAEAESAGVPADYVATAFTDQINATEAIQYNRFSLGGSSISRRPRLNPDLSASRSQIDELNKRMVGEIARQWPVLQSGECPAQLEAAKSEVAGSRRFDPLYRQALDVATRSLLQPLSQPRRAIQSDRADRQVSRRPPRHLGRTRHPPPAGMIRCPVYKNEVDNKLSTLVTSWSWKEAVNTFARSCNHLS